jgi:hypothetical protein
MTNIFTPRENNRLLDYYKIISISRPILARANMGFDFVSGQYGCLFSRCRKYVINSLIHGHFHIGLVIIPRPILAPSTPSRANMGREMITRPIWKCPCINLYLFTFLSVDMEILTPEYSLRHSRNMYRLLKGVKISISTDRNANFLSNLSPVI